MLCPRARLAWSRPAPSFVLSLSLRTTKHVQMHSLKRPRTNADATTCRAWCPFSRDHLIHMWKNKELCDVVVRTTSGVERAAHAVVLASQSEYFRGCFCFRTMANGHCRAPVMLGDWSESVVDVMLLYVYCGDCQIPHSLLQEAIEFADMLHLRSLRDAAVQHWTASLTNDTCVAAWVLAHRLQLDELWEFARQHALFAFEELGRTIHILPRDLLLKLIRDDNLHATSERVVFSAVENYVLHHNLTVDESLPLMSSIRFSLMERTERDFPAFVLASPVMYFPPTHLQRSSMRTPGRFYECVFERFSTLKQKFVYSQGMSIGSRSGWRIMLFPRGNPSDSHWVSAYLCAPKLKDGERHDIKFTFKVQGATLNGCDIMKKTTHVFSTEEMDWGWKRLVPRLGNMSTTRPAWLGKSDTFILRLFAEPQQPPSS